MSRILIIEDETSIAELERDYLEISGYEVDICSDGRTGLAAVQTGNYDLVILDLMLPGMDGFEVCRQIREEQEIPVIVVSAKKDDMDKVHALGLGADDYITKPFSPSELVARVKAHLERFNRLTGVAKRSGDTIEYKNLVIDKAARKVTVDGEDKVLTAKQFELLLFLATHPNRVFSKKELFEEIWGMTPIDTDLPTVTVHIKKIREKLNDTSSNSKYIDTIWGVGYRFKG